MKAIVSLKSHFPRRLLASLAIGLMCQVSTSSAEAFQRVEHSTSLKAVYVHAIPESDQVITQLLIGAGEVDAEGAQGLAHYVEHLVMTDYQIKNGRKPTPHRANAFTSVTLTNYVAAGLPMALPGFIRQMASVLERPSLSAQEMTRERNVVSREFDLNVLQNPRRNAYQRVGNLLFQSHPLQRSVIGTRVSIENLQPANALEFHQQFYKASNATLIVVGNIETKAVRRLVNQAFAHFKSSPIPERPWQAQRTWDSRHVTVAVPDDDAKRSAILWRAVVDAREWDRRKLLSAAEMLSSLMNSALPGGLEGPLYNDAYFVSGYQFQMRLLPGGFAEAMFSAYPAEDVTSAQAMDAFRDEIKKIAQNGLPTNSIDRVRNRLSKRAELYRTHVSMHAQRSLFWAAHDIPPLSSAAEDKLRKTIAKPELDLLIRALANPIRSAAALIEPSTRGEN